MAAGSGGTSYFLLADQVNAGVLAAWGTYRKWVYGFISGGIGVAADFATFDANNGSYAGSPPIMGQEGSEGSITLPHDSEGMGFWLKHMMRKVPTSTQYYSTIWSMKAAGAYTTPITSFTSGTQPKEKLQSITDAIPGINAAKIEFTFAGATADTSAGKQPRVIIEGDDQIGTPLTEVRVLTATELAALTTAFKSQFYFSEVRKITVVDISGGTVAVKGDASNYYKHEFSVGESLLTGMSVEMVKGVIPERIRDVHVSQMGYTVGDTNQMTVGLIGGRAEPETNAQDGGTDPSDLTGKERQPGTNASGWATILRIDDKILRCGEASLDVNYNLGTNENPYCRQAYRPAPVISAKRTAAMSTRVSYPAQIYNGEGVADTEWGIKDMMSYVRCREMAVSIEAAITECGGANNFMNMKMPTAKFNEVPDPRDISAGQINNPLSFAGFKKGNGNDLEIMVVNSEDATAFIA